MHLSCHTCAFIAAPPTKFYCAIGAGKFTIAESIRVSIEVDQNAFLLSFPEDAVASEVGGYWPPEISNQASAKNHPITLLDFTENVDNFEARTERVNFGLFRLNSDFT